jgi:hypothetical protein
MRNDDRESELRPHATDDEGERDDSSNPRQLSNDDDSLQRTSSSCSIFSERASNSRATTGYGASLTGTRDVVDHGPTLCSTEIDTVVEEDSLGDFERRAVSLDQFEPSLAIIGGVWDPFRTYPSALPESLIAKCNHYCRFPLLVTS